MKDPIVGIDLGTTNSAIASLQDGVPRVIDIDGAPSLPSCVGIDPTGQLLVGRPARNQLVAAPDSTVTSIKRLMGRDTTVTLGDRTFTPEEISALILRELKLRAEAALGHPVTRAVITVPAFFDENQRKATQNAGTLAGLEVVRIINEPTAAALAYEAGERGDERILVYDLGGGTFDVSAVVVEGGVVEVKASHGDTQLGGDDFDALLVGHVAARFEAEHGIDLTADPATARRLQVALERAKCRLSDEPFTTVREEFVHGDLHLELEIDRTTYEELITPLLEKTLACVQRALEDAAIPASKLDKVMLVGGSTRTPLVHQILRQRLRIEPRHEIDPDLIVALGAAIQGGASAGEKSRAILVDITPHSFGTDAVDTGGWSADTYYVPVIHRNTPLPASKSEVFNTIHDNQDTVRVKAFQGESDVPDNNLFLGEFLIEGLSPVPRGNPIVTQFDLDLDGLLRVTATEKATGLRASVTLDTRGTCDTLDLDAAAANLRATTGDAPPAPADATTLDPTLLATTRDLEKRARALLASGIDPEDATEIGLLLDQCATAERDADAPTLIEKSEILADLVYYLED